MEYYQKASQALRSGEEYPLQILKNAGLTAIGGGAATVGSKAINKLIPAIGALINDYVPENISKTGLSKIEPRFGKFINGALEEGYSYDDLRNFIGEKINKSKASQADTKNKNIIEQYSPELHQFLSKEIQGGRSALEAGALAQLQKPFKTIIDKLTKDHKSPFSSILQTVYGQLQPQQNQQPEEKISPNMQRIMELLQQRNKR